MATNWENDIVRLQNKVLGRQRGKIITKEAPYDLGIMPDKTLHEYTDPHNEQATLAHWKPVLDSLGIEILGIRDVPDEPVRVMVDNIEWLFTRMSADEYEVPESCYHTIRAAEAAGVPFAYWIYGEELFDRPKFRPMSEPKVRKLWSQLQETFTNVRENINDKLLDPCIIGVIPTAPNHGIWCLCAKWLD